MYYLGCVNNCRLRLRSSITNNLHGNWRKTHLIRRNKTTLTNEKQHRLNASEFPENTIIEVADIINHSPRKKIKIERSLSSNSLKTLAEFVKKETSTRSVQVPTTRQLRLVALEAAVPFVGFGFVDNAVMIVAGDFIDVRLGVAFGISTIAAAGLGNLVSDVLGVGLGSVVETWAAKLGLPNAGLTRAQENLKITKFASNLGCAIGVTIGCLLGMFPLLFLDTSKSKRLKFDNEIDQLFQTVFAYVGEALGCENATLYLIDNELNELWTEAKTGGIPVRIPLGSGTIGECAESGRTINQTLKSENGQQSSLCMPIFDTDGKVVAVVQATNKNNGQPFSLEDEQLLGTMLSHISVALENIMRPSDRERVSLLEGFKCCTLHIDMHQSQK